MTKTIKTANQSIQLTFNKAANCWQSTTLLHNTHIEIEIDFAIHKEKEVDWAHFSEFIQFIGVAGRLEQPAQNGILVITEIGKALFGANFEPKLLIIHINHEITRKEKCIKNHPTWI